MTAAVASLFTAERAQWESFLSALREVLAKQPDVASAWLYGSVARGEDKPESDVDIAVLLESGRQAEHVRDALSALERQVNASFSIITLKRRELEPGAGSPRAAGMAANAPARCHLPPCRP